MNNAIVKNGANVVALDAVKSAYMSNPTMNEKDANVALVDKYLKQLDSKVNENSNMAYSI